MEEVRRLGRWATLSSVERYSKTFRLVGAREDLPQNIREKGVELLQDPAQLVQIILNAQPRHTMGCCRRRRKPRAHVKKSFVDKALDTLGGVVDAILDEE